MIGRQGPRPVVLVVEDELLIRLNAVEMIEDAGFEAVEAENADAAIKILESRGDIQLVFTDIRMPGSIDGLKLAHAIRDRWPPIKIVVTSGHMLVSESALPTNGRFLRKPYGRAEVVAMLEGIG